MPKNRDRERFEDDDLQDDRAAEWGLPETHLRAMGLLNEIIRMTPRNDPRLDYLYLLRHQLETDENQLEEAQKVIAEFEEAYTKLTSPANRIGVYLGRVDDETVQIALGDQEYIANVDPKMKEAVGSKQEAGGTTQEAATADQLSTLSTPSTNSDPIHNTQHPIPNTQYPTT